MSIGGRTIFENPLLTVRSLDETPNDQQSEIAISLTTVEIDHLIELLKMLKSNADQHFHATSNFKGTGGVGQITFDVQSAAQENNLELGGLALAPGETIPD